MAVRLYREVGIIQVFNLDDTDLFCFNARMVDKELRQKHSAVLSIKRIRGTTLICFQTISINKN